MAAHQAPLSLGVSPGQNTGVGCHFLLQCMHACMLSHFCRVLLCATLWIAALQAPLSTGFSRQEYWSGLPYLEIVPLFIVVTSCFSWWWTNVFSKLHQQFIFSRELYRNAPRALHYGYVLNLTFMIATTMSLTYSNYHSPVSIQLSLHIVGDWFHDAHRCQTPWILRCLTYNDVIFAYNLYIASYIFLLKKYTSSHL